MGAVPLSSRPTHVRYAVLGLTFGAYMITYMDRQILAVSRPVIGKELGISLVMMGNITFAFRLAYALFQIPGGWLGDRFGARRALAAVVTWWSLFTALTGMAWNGISMLTIQTFFGLGEAGAFPIATRSLARWMRPAERGFAQGVTHAGSRLGAALTPPIAVFIIARYGWRTGFFAFGVLGLIWSAAWFAYYRDTPEEHRGVNDAEREWIGASRRAEIGADPLAKKFLKAYHGNPGGFSPSCISATTSISTFTTIGFRRTCMIRAA